MRTIGLREEIIFFGANGEKKLVARVDTGATKSSIDKSVAEELGLGPAHREAMVKSAHGSKVRPVVRAKVQFADQEFLAEFTVADREHLKYRALVGRNILKKGFLIDTTQ